MTEAWGGAASDFVLHEASGAVVFAVADGVPRAAESHLAAAEACQAAMERLLFLLTRDRGSDAALDLESVAYHAAERLERLAASRFRASDRSADLFGTTLVAGVVHLEPTGPKLQACRVGDSGAWLLDRATGTYHPLFGANTGSDTCLLPHVPDPVEQVMDHLILQPHLVVRVVSGPVVESGCAERVSDDGGARCSSRS